MLESLIPFFVIITELYMVFIAMIRLRTLIFSSKIILQTTEIS